MAIENVFIFGKLQLFFELDNYFLNFNEFSKNLLQMYLEL